MHIANSIRKNTIQEKATGAVATLIRGELQLVYSFCSRTSELFLGLRPLLTLAGFKEARLAALFSARVTLEEAFFFKDCAQTMIKLI